MFEKILVPLDGTDLAEMALSYSEELATSLGSEVILLHVHGAGDQQYEHMHKVYLERIAENVRRNIEKNSLKSSEVKITTKVEIGEPSENICNFVEKNDITLIIMTSAGASSLRAAKKLGSVSDHICHTVPIPVMLIRPHNTEEIEGRKRLINRLLLPLDGSDLSKLALPIGEELANKLSIPITLFQMIQVILPYGGEAAPFVDYDKFSQDEMESVRNEILAIEKELTGKSLDVSHRVTIGGDAAHEIIESGKNIGADLVVMSTHGRSGLAHWALGSIAEKVLRYGEIPLLLVNVRA